MIYRLLMFGAATLAATFPANVMADVRTPFVAASVVSDQELAKLHGTASPYAMLTRGNLARLADSQSRSDFRVVGSIATLQMEAWWGTIGSELIANAVRNQP